MGYPETHPGSDQLADDNERASVAADHFLAASLDAALPAPGASAALWARIEADEAKEGGCSEGALCGREGCEGRMEWQHSKECYCFRSPPCHFCTEATLVCSQCNFKVDII